MKNVNSKLECRKGTIRVTSEKSLAKDVFAQKIVQLKTNRPLARPHIILVGDRDVAYWASFIKASMACRLEATLETGRRLAAAKDTLVKHGQFFMRS